MSSERPAILVYDLGKRYRLRHHGQATLKTAALHLLRRGPAEEFWALRHVGFEVRRGETLGIIGRNGAGKSTLLGLVTGTVTPTEGEVRADGRISSLLELGAGFHPDLSGRENVFLNGSILGLARREIAARFDRIVAFAELERFIDTPVRHYSSGMFVRLAFSVAMEVDPDILIIDEVLSVGDERFQHKCRTRIADFRARGRTLLIVSHDMETIQGLCDRTLLLNRGQAVLLDSPARVIHEYRAIATYEDGRAPEAREWGTREAEIREVALLDGADRPATDFPGGGCLRARIRYRAREPVPEPVFGFALSDAEGRLIFGSNTAIEGVPLPALARDGEVLMEIAPLPLLRGRYYLSFAIHSRDHRTFHRLDNRYAITVQPGAGGPDGFVRLPVRWRIPGPARGA